MNQKKVLLMDDNEAVLNSTSQLIQVLGHEVETCLNGKDAIELHRQAFEEGKPFDIVILDIYVPNGFGAADCIKEIKETNPKVNAVITSGDLNSDYITNYNKYGFDNYMCKPFGSKTLMKILEID